MTTAAKIADENPGGNFHLYEQAGEQTGKTFGDKTNPLLVSVRSGSLASNARHDGHILNWA